MSRPKYHYALFAVPLLIFGAAGAGAQSSPNSSNSAADSSVPAPDNTRVNKQNASSTTGNADDQKQDASDLALTKRIRKSVLADKNLSTYGHNVKIVAVNGTVTLNGVVRSEQERDEIGTKAAKVAGNDHVVNDLTVAPAQ